jgi:hypothetical protein
MHRTLRLLATLCFAAGTILMLAMAFRMLPQGWALFLGTSCFVVGGLLYGQTSEAAVDPAARPAFKPTVSPRDEV